MFEIGTTLREARLRGQIDLVEAEQDTKIRSKYLAALETEDFDLLPGAVYVRGFLRTYARYLGLDAQLYVDEYNERFGRYEDIDDASSPVLARPAPDLIPRRSPFTLRRLAVGCLVLLAFLAWYGLRTDERVTPQGSQDVLRASEPDSLEAAADQAETSTTPEPVAAPVKPAAAPPTLALHASGGDSWLEVRVGGPNGAVRFSGTLRDGARRTFPGKRLHLTVGVPSVMRFRTGGKVVQGRGDATASFTVTPGRVRQLP